MLKQLLLAALAAWMLMVLVLDFVDIPFSAVAPHWWWTRLAYMLTQSGGTVGSTIGIAIACFLYTMNEHGWLPKIKVFLKAASGLVLLIGGLALFNERITKPLVKAERPSHAYVLNRLHTSALVDSLYQLSKDERVAWFGSQIHLNNDLFKQIDPEVLEHWIEEGGYSFPSGHTFNAFLLAMIFGYGIRNTTSGNDRKKLFWLPFAWAAAVGLSRVGLGAHHIRDVAAGGLMGIGIGTLLLYIDFTRSFLTHKK